MNLRTTIFVVLLAIVLLGYVLVFETDLVFERAAEPDPTPTAEASGKPLLEDGELRPGQIRSFTIKPADGTPLVAERDPNGELDWRQIEPVAFDLKDTPVENLADAIAELHYTNVIEDANMSRFGLDAPSHTVTMMAERDGRKIRHTLALGRTSAAGRAYLRVDDSADVHVVDDSLHGQLVGQDLKAWRETSLPQITPGTIQTIVLDRADAPVTIAQRNGKWAFARGATGRVAADAAESLVNVINMAQIRQFVIDHPADLAPYGLDDPRYTLTLHRRPTDPNDPNSTQTYRLRVGRATDLAAEESFAMWDDLPMVFTIGSTQVTKLAKGIDDLRDARLTPIRTAEVHEITVTDTERDQPRLHFVRDRGAWRFGEIDPGYDAAPNQVNRLLRALTQTEAEDFEPGTPDDAFSTIVRLAVTGRAEDEVLHIAPPDDDSDRFRVIRGNERVTYLVQADALTPVLDQPITYRDRQVLDIAPSRVVGLSVSLDNPPAQFELKRRQTSDGNYGAWQLDGYDRTAVQDLLNALHPLRAAGWIEVHDMALLPETIELTLADGSTRTLRVDSDRMLGSAQGVTGRFKLSPATIDALTAELRERKVIDLALEDIASVDTGTMVIERNDQGAYARADGEKLKQEKAGALFDTLAGLHAQRFVPADWAKINQNNPSAQLAVTSSDARSITLDLWSADDSDRSVPLGRVDEGKVFTLTPTQFKKLTALQ